MLAAVLSNSYLLPKYKEAELHVSSVKAIISIKENAVHELWSHYDFLVDDQVFMRGDHIEIAMLSKGIYRYLRYANMLLRQDRLLIYAMKVILTSLSWWQGC